MNNFVVSYDSHFEESPMEVPIYSLTGATDDLSSVPDIDEKKKKYKQKKNIKISRT